MERYNKSPTDQITQEFLDSGTLYFLGAKYLSLVTKAVQENNFSKVLPDQMGCRGKAGKIATELVIRFLNKYGLILTYNSFNSEYSSHRGNRDSASTLLDIAKLKDSTNPLHELVQIMKNTERHQYHHPKLVQALMNKVPQLLNDETKSHFNKILSRATVAKRGREPNSKERGNLGENFSPINPQQNIRNDSQIINREATLSPNNQITTKIQQPLVFLDEGTDKNSPGKPHNVMLTLNLNIKNPEEQVTLEMEPPSPKPSQITATAVLLPNGDDYQKISSSNGTNQLLNEEEEAREIPPLNYQNRDVQNIDNQPNRNQDDKEYEYDYEYEEVEIPDMNAYQVSNPNLKPDIIVNENVPKEKIDKAKKDNQPKKNQKAGKSSKKPKKKNTIDPQIQQQLEQQQLIIKQLQELNQSQQQQQYEQQQKLLQQIQQQELQQQQLQQQLEQQQIQNEIQQQKIQQQLQEQQYQQQLQREQIQQQLQLDPLQKTYRPSPGKFTNKDFSPINVSQTGATSSSSLSFIEGIQDKNASDHASSYIEKNVFPEINQKQNSDIPEEKTDNASEINGDESQNEGSITSIADYINEEANTKKRNIKPVSNALDNLLKIKNQAFDDDESTVIIPIEKKRAQLSIAQFSMPEVPFNDNEEYSYTNNSHYSYDSERSSYTAPYSNTEYSVGNNVIDDIVNNEDSSDEIINNINLNNDNNVIENDEPASSQTVSIVSKDYPGSANIVRSIKSQLSPIKEKQDSFTDTNKEYLSETDYYSSDYYSDDYSRTEESQKQLKLKLRINKEQFERLYPNQNLSNAPTIKVSKSDLNQLQQLINQNNNEPIKQVIRLKTPILPPAPQSPKREPDSNSSSSSTINVVTKGPHAGCIKRRIKKSDRTADVQKKLKEKTEYAKKLQEELQRREKEMEVLKAKQDTNLPMNNKKLVRSQPQTSKQRKGAKERSVSPNYENERPNSAPKKIKGKSIKKRDLQFPEEINTSSLILPTISSVSEVHPELMSPKQRYAKKKEIQKRIDKLRDELQQPSDPDEKRIRKAKIEAKLKQLKDEYQRPSDEPELDLKKPNQKKSRRTSQTPQSPTQKDKKQNRNFNQLSSAQRRKRRHEIELELQRLHEELDMTTGSDLPNQSIPNGQYQNRSINIPQNQTNQNIMQQMPIPQPRPRQLQQQPQYNQYQQLPQQQNANPPIFSDKKSSDYTNSYNENNDYSYSQSPIEKKFQGQPPPPQRRTNDADFQDQQSFPKNRAVMNDSSNETDNNESAISLSERRNYPKLKLDIIKNDDNEDQDRDISDYGLDSDTNSEPSINSDDVENVEYKPQKINIKKNAPPLKNDNENSSQIEFDNDNIQNKSKNILNDNRQVVDEQIVIKDGKKKKKRRIHIPIQNSNQDNNNSGNNYNYNYSENNSISENFEQKKVIAKSSSKNRNTDENKMDGGLGQQQNDLLSSNYYSETNFSSFRLLINVIEAKDVPGLDSLDLCDPYCLLYVDGQGESKAFRTKSKEKTSHPVWNEKFEFEVVNNEKTQTNHSCFLNVQIKDQDDTHKDDLLLSSAKINLFSFSAGKVIDQWFPLHRGVVVGDSYSSKPKKDENSMKSGTSHTTSSRGGDPKKGGMVHLVLEKIPLLDEGGYSQTEKHPSHSNKNVKLFENQNGQKLCLRITVDQANGLSKRNQYIVAKIKNTYDSCKTRLINSSEPIWHESFKLKLPNPQDDVLLVTLRTKDEQHGTDDIGSISIPISSLNPPGSQVVDNWYEFRSTSYSTPNKVKMHRSAHSSAQKMCGKIHLILNVEYDKDDTFTDSNPSSGYSNSVTPNASSNNSAYRSSSIPKLNPNPSISIKPTPNSAARHLAVEIIEARGLPSRCSPFCVVQIQGEKRTLVTRAVRQAPLPRWNQKLDFYSRKAVEDGILDISIKDRRSNTEVASLSLPLEEMNNDRKIKENDENEQNTVINQWYPIEPSGEIHLIIIPRMKDSPKPSIHTSNRETNNNDNLNSNNNNTKSNDEEPVILIDASSSDIDIDTQSDEGNNTSKRRLRRKSKKRLSAYSGEHNNADEIDSHKKKILAQFPTTSEEE